jgi:NUMOD3 motif
MTVTSSAATTTGLDMTKKGRKLSLEERLRISIGRLNSPIIQAKKEETKRRKELEKQLQKQIKAEEIAARGWIRNSPETRRKISLAHKGRTPWNKGVEAWNRNRPWSDEVKDNISRGMVVYWIQKKEHHHQQLTSAEVNNTAKQK